MLKFLSNTANSPGLHIFVETLFTYVPYLISNVEKSIAIIYLFHTRPRTLSDAINTK